MTGILDFTLSRGFSVSFSWFAAEPVHPPPNKICFGPKIYETDKKNPEVSCFELKVGNLGAKGSIHFTFLFATLRKRPRDSGSL